ncbi:26S proteasome non-ATPase regulatory subunit 10 [Elysia marginata]|uniref:26S proteasome non-ATPase regulatory subunit 10 n=1 Tax=Elysia marginata TaxID=1093978 RepID=A0AAV4GCD5_9GAST|nr:26S proteasome non-ATPase regulatory subunit 10 [Elysia marginata]
MDATNCTIRSFFFFSLLFRCSLHTAVLNNSLDVVKVLLKYGVDPNEPQGLPGLPKSRRSSYQSSCGTDGSSPVAGLGVPGSQVASPSPCEHLDQRLSPSPTLIIQGPDSPKLSRLDERLGSRTPDEQRKAADIVHGHRCHVSIDHSQHYISHSRSPTSSQASVTARLGPNVCKSHQHQGSHTYQQQSNLTASSSVTVSSSHSTIRTGATSARGKTLEPPSRSPGNRRANSPACQLPEIVETVIEDGFNYGTHYTRDELFNLPCLYLAVVEGNPYFVQLLLRYGALPNIQDLYGCSPLHLACCAEFYNIEIIRILLRCGAKIYLENALSDSPFNLWPGTSLQTLKQSAHRPSPAESCLHLAHSEVIGTRGHRADGNRSLGSTIHFRAMPAAETLLC